MKLKRVLQIALVALLFAPFQANALSLGIDTILYEDDGYIIDETLLSGTADLSVSVVSGGYNLEILLRNTTVSGAVDDGGSSRWLTGIGFDLPDEFNVSMGTAVLSSGSVLYDSGSSVDTSSTSGDISGDWGYLSGISGHFNDFGTATDTQVSTMRSDTGDNAFNDALRTYYDSLATLDGPPMGLVSGNNSLAGGWSIMDGLTLNLYVAGDGYTTAELESIIDSGEVVLTFGSPGAKVPEPTILFLTGLGMLAAWGVSRKLKTSKSTS
jgi:hypothetical protein